MEEAENKNLIDKIQKNLGSSLKLKNIDDFKINGDFIESQLSLTWPYDLYLNFQFLFQILLDAKLPPQVEKL